MATEKTSDRWTKICYRDFWDVPRIFIANSGDSSILFDCRFDDEVEDFPDEYRVFVLPLIDESDLPESWDRLSERANSFLGSIPVSSVEFDRTKRSAVHSDWLMETLGQLGIQHTSTHR